MTENPEEYLKQGEQTKITPAIKKISSAIKGENFEYLLNTLEWLNKNITYPQSQKVQKNDIFRKRTAEDIISDGYATGCTDFALVFISLSRANNIPTKYVEVIAKNYFKNNLDKVAGHVYAECFIGKKWYGVDPMAGYIKYSVRYPGFVVYGRGLDSWDLGINDLESMRNKFKEFAKSRLKENG